MTIIWRGTDFGIASPLNLSHGFAKTVFITFCAAIGRPPLANVSQVEYYTDNAIF